MIASTELDAVQTAAGSARRIRSALEHTETEIGTVAADFEKLATHTHEVLDPAAAIVGCMEEHGLSTILPKVEGLGDAVRGYIQERLQATAGMLEMVNREARLLEKLSELTRGQRSVVRETQTLSVLTNIEVARLGSLGAGFQYLARELDDFSRTVTEGIKELSAHTEERRGAIDQTRRLLSAGLPRIQTEFARIENDLGAALEAVRESHGQLLQAPVRFQACVQEIAAQIAGVVAAVQAHDITRQQLEHVEEGMNWIANALREPGEEAAAGALPTAGLEIQDYQLRCVERTVEQWLTQIADCMSAILQVSSSEILGIGPLVLEQEKELSKHLEMIERIEQECQSDNREVREMLEGLGNLMQLVGEHVEKSRVVRDRLQLLTFNSIVEASHLGTQADAILEISQCIKKLSTTWSELTDRSAESKEEILNMVDRARTEMQSFSAEGTEELRTAQAETRLGLENLRQAATEATSRAGEVEAALERLQTRIASVGAARDSLRTSFADAVAAREEIETLARHLTVVYPEARRHWRGCGAETVFGECYTIELERDVLHAALNGAPLPEAHHNLEGNDVELF